MSVSDKKSILITGGTGGLGNTVLYDLLDAGYSITNISESANEPFEEKIAAYISNNKLAQTAKFLSMDLSQELDIHKFDIDYENMDHAVFMHARMYRDNILELPLNTLLQSLMVNYVSTFGLARHCIKMWLEKSKTNNVPISNKSITFISSVAVKGGAADEVAYHSAKRAMEAAMLSFAREFSSQNIRANVISPGLMDTPMGVKTVQDRPDVLDRIPMKALTSTKDISETIKFCMNNTSLTGQVIHVNKGRYFSI